MAPRIGRSLLFGVIALLLSLLIALMIGEFALRITGSAPLDVVRANSWTMEPDDGFFVYSRRRGYAYGPGRFVVTFDSGHEFSITHDGDGLRATPSTGGAPEVWVLGGSFTHGWSVDDDETFPWALADLVDSIQVRNFGVGGYGTLLSLIQLEEALEQRAAPETVVLAYASFHDERNVWTRSWRRAIAPSDPEAGHPIPRARYASGGFEVVREVPRHRPFPLEHRSALMHQLGDKAGRIENRLRLRSREVTEAILLAMRDLCEKAGTRFLVAGILDNEATRRRLAFCADAGIDTVDISVDLDAGLRNLPHDEHPGPAAHAIYAKKLAELLR